MSGAIFDLDGTLLDSMPIWRAAGDRYLRGLGRVPEEGLDRKLFSMSVPDGAAWLKKNYDLPFSPQQIIDGINGTMAEAYRAEVPLKPGAEALLKALAARGVRLAVATASDRPLVESALSRLGVLPLFEGIFTCTEIGAGKGESPAVYLAAAQALGGVPADCWVFEDALHAARTAAGAGFRVVGVYDESGAEDWEALRKVSEVSLESLERAEAFWKAFGEGKA